MLHVVQHYFPTRPPSDLHGEMRQPDQQSPQASCNECLRLTLSSHWPGGMSMTYLNLIDSAEPCFITDGPPSSDLPMPAHRTMSLPQILEGLTDEDRKSTRLNSRH